MVQIKANESEQQMKKENMLAKYLKNFVNSISLNINNAETIVYYCSLVQGTELEWTELENEVTVERKKLLESNESMNENSVENLQKTAKLDEVEAKIKELRAMSPEDIEELKKRMLEKLQNESVKVDLQIQHVAESLTQTPDNQQLLNLFAKRSELNRKLETLLAEMEPNQQFEIIYNQDMKLAGIEEKHQQEIEMKDQKLAKVVKKHQQEVDQLKQELHELKIRNENPKDDTGIKNNIKRFRLFMFRTLLVVILIALLVTTMMVLFSKNTPCPRCPVSVIKTVETVKNPKTSWFRRWGIALVSSEPKSVCLEW